MRNHITFSAASKQDANITWNWRNDPATRTYFHDPAPISEDRHISWWQNSLEIPTRSLLLAWCGSLRVGVLRFDYDGNEAIVSIYLDPALTGIGLGTSILEAGTGWLRRHRPDIKKQRAEILPANFRSRRSFHLAGYLQMDKLTWVRSMSDA
jgi:RimJ/RimL family protein N-acetyltransferase